MIFIVKIIFKMALSRMLRFSEGLSKKKIPHTHTRARIHVKDL